MHSRPRTGRPKSRKWSGLKPLMVIFAVLLALGAAEVAARLLSKGMLAEQNARNAIRPGDSDSLRIVTLGDSMGTGYEDPGGPWPSMLEAFLLEKGVKARVYNLARPATTMSLILDRLPEELDHFRPDIVISMMGMDDTGA